MNNPSQSGDDAASILYDVRVAIPDGTEVIARFRTDGMMQIGRTLDNLRTLPFFISPITKKPWIPSYTDFVDAITDALVNGQYDLDGENPPCLESLLQSLKRMPCPLASTSDTPTACTPPTDAPLKEPENQSESLPVSG